MDIDAEVGISFGDEENQKHNRTVRKLIVNFEDCTFRLQHWLQSFTIHDGPEDEKYDLHTCATKSSTTEKKTTLRPTPRTIFYVNTYKKIKKLRVLR